MFQLPLLHVCFSVLYHNSCLFFFFFPLLISSSSSSSSSSFSSKDCFQFDLCFIPCLKSPTVTFLFSILLILLYCIPHEMSFIASLTENKFFNPSLQCTVLFHQTSFFPNFSARSGHLLKSASSDSHPGSQPTVLHLFWI